MGCMQFLTPIKTRHEDLTTIAAAQTASNGTDALKGEIDDRHPGASHTIG
jgi:hypothetical protein